MSDVCWKYVFSLHFNVRNVWAEQGLSPLNSKATFDQMFFKSACQVNFDSWS